MSLLTVTEIGQTEVDMDSALQAAALAGDSYPNDERTFFVVDAPTNAVVATIAKTRDTADKHGFGSLGVDDITLTVGIGERKSVRVPVASHGDAAGRVKITYDVITGVLVGAFKLDRH